MDLFREKHAPQAECGPSQKARAGLSEFTFSTQVCCLMISRWSLQLQALTPALSDSSISEVPQRVYGLQLHYMTIVAIGKTGKSNI